MHGSHEIVSGSRLGHTAEQRQHDRTVIWANDETRGNTRVKLLGFGVAVATLAGMLAFTSSTLPRLQPACKEALTVSAEPEHYPIPMYLCLAAESGGIFQGGATQSSDWNSSEGC